RTAEARHDLRALANDGFELPRDGGWLVYMSLLAAVAAELNDRASAARLYDLLLPYADRLGIVGAGLACWGSISCYLGLLASALGRVADATRHFEDAAEVPKEIHVADLIAASTGAPPDPRSVPAAELVAQGLRVSPGVSGDAVLDRRARADYRERLADLHRELDDAERCHDDGRVARARAELDFIAGELASAFGLGGRGRRAGSPIERARKAVASRIRFSLTHIARVHPALADHLRRYLRTGTICTYVVPDEPVR